MDIFTGEVEDINDTEMLSRVKVRVHNVHERSKLILPTEDLNWATVLLPVTSANIKGSGSTHGLLVGSHVVGFFLDKAQQNFVVMGTIVGKDIPERGKTNYPQNRCYVSEVGHSIEFNDGDNTMTLTHSGGKILRFEDSQTILTTKDLVVVTDNDNVTYTKGTKNDHTDGVLNLSSNGKMFLSSNSEIILSAPMININPVVGVARREFLEPNILSATVRAFTNVTILQDNPDANIADEATGTQKYGNVCLVGDAENPCDFLNDQLDLDWTEGNNPNISALFEELGFPAYGGNVAWCAALVGATLKRCKLKYLRTLSSRDYVGYGKEVTFNSDGSELEVMMSKLANATRGDILVFDRGAGFGHVGFFTGEYDPATGKYGCLGGNQGNTLKVSYYNIRTDKYLRLTNIRKTEICRDKTYAEIAEGDTSGCALPETINDNDDFQLFIRNLYYEARGDSSDEGLIAVGHSVLNRVTLGKNGESFPDNPSDVIKQPLQYSWYNRGTSTRTAVPTEKEAWMRCCKIGKGILKGDYTDPTGGAFAYYAKGSMRDEDFMKRFPKPIKFVGEYGKHRFFKLA